MPATEHLFHSWGLAKVINIVLNLIFHANFNTSECVQSQSELFFTNKIKLKVIDTDFHSIIGFYRSEEDI